MSCRLFTEDKLVLATHNPGKVIEIGALLAPYNVDVVSAGELGLPEPVEDGDTFTANALLKAKAAAEASNLPALADDSGLCVHALDDAPGIYSARWAGPKKDFGLAMERVEKELAGKEDRSAHFSCVLALAWPDGHAETFDGRVYGDMVWPAVGTNGFGYDPVFVPSGHTITFGVMDPAMKHKMSHRAQAFEKLITGCFKKDA